MSTSWIIDYKDIILCRPGSRMSSKVSLQYKKKCIINIFFSESRIIQKIERPLVHFRVPSCLCIKTRLSAQPLIWKWFFILMQIKLTSARKVVHFASFWKWGFLELRSGLLKRAFCLMKYFTITLLILDVICNGNWPCMLLSNQEAKSSVLAIF